METIQLTIPDELLNQAIEALTPGYQAQIPDPDWIDPEDGSERPMIDNPVSQAKTARKALYSFIRSRVKRKLYKEQQAVNSESLETALEVKRTELITLDEA